MSFPTATIRCWATSSPVRVSVTFWSRLTTFSRVRSIDWALVSRRFSNSLELSASRLSMSPWTLVSLLSTDVLTDCIIDWSCWVRTRPLCSMMMRISCWSISSPCLSRLMETSRYTSNTTRMMITPPPPMRSSKPYSVRKSIVLSYQLFLSL